MSSLEWQDLRDDARTLDRQYPALGHTLAYSSAPLRMAGTVVFDHSVLDFRSPEVLLPIRDHRLPPAGGYQVAQRVFHMKPGLGVSLLWTRADVDQQGLVEKWQSLMQRIKRKSGAAIQPTLGPGDDITWPALHRVAWTAEGRTAYKRTLGWAAEPVGHPGTIVVIPVHLPLSPSVPATPCVTRTEAEQRAGLPDTGTVFDGPLTLLGWWCSTVEPAGAALVAMIDALQMNAVRKDPGTWLTVTEAARLLLDDVSGIDLGNAKARVSKTANESRFRTNGRRGPDRRIDRDSFSTWRIEQRERDLAAFD